MLVVPFMKNKQNLEFYSLLVPFIFFHWSVNDDTCALTQMEMVVTGNSKDETFFGRVMGPCLLYTSPSPRDLSTSRMPSSA